MLSLEQQHLFDHLEVIARLTCEMCFETGEIYFSFLPPAEQTGDYYADIFQSVVGTFSEKWRVLSHPSQVSAYHKKKQALFLAMNELPDDTILPMEPGEPVVVCQRCAEVLEQESQAGNS